MAEFGTKVPGGYAGENAWNSRLTEALRHLGYEADFEVLFNTLKGQRKPDVAAKTDRGLCIISGKLGERKEIDALSTAQEYHQTIGALQSLSEVFAVTYPSNKTEEFRLRALATVSHDALSWSFRNLDEVAKRIDEMLKEDYEGARRYAEPEELATIRVLRRGVDELSATLMGLEESEVEAIFGGRTFFETVLGYAQEGRIPVRYLKIAAAYLLVNQLLFYERLVAETRKYAEISDEDLSRPSQLKPIYFDRVLEDDYNAIFNFDVAKRLRGEQAGDATKKVVLALRALAPGRLRRDILGKVFHNLIPLELRKVVAAYFTNSSAAELLAGLAIGNGKASVADFACGSGTLLVAAYDQKRKLLEGKSDLTEREHKRFVEKELTGVDIMPFSAHLAAVHLALQAPLHHTDNVRIVIADSTTLRPGVELDAAKEVLKDAFKNRTLDSFTSGSYEVSREKVLKGTLSLRGGRRKLTLENVDVVMMNPPFTRHERLSEAYKANLVRRFAQYNKYLRGQLSYHGFFMFLADRFLREGGTMAFVLPATTLRLRGAEGARQLLADQYYVEFVITTFQRAAFSEDAEFREVLLIARKRQAKEKEMTKLVYLSKIPGKQPEIDGVIRAIGQGGDKQVGVNVYQVPYSEYKANVRNQFLFIAAADWKLVDFWRQLKLRAGPNLIAFATLLESRKGGFLSSLRIERDTPISTPSMFVSRSIEQGKKEADRWLLKEESSETIVAEDRFTHDLVKIPRTSVKPGLRRGSSIERVNIQEVMDYVVVGRFHNDDRFFRTMSSRIENDLQKWKEKVEDRLTPLSLFRRFDISAVGTRHLAFFSKIPYAATDINLTVKGLDEEEAKLIAAWYDSSFNILQILLERVETRGAFLEVPVFVSEELSVIDPSKIERTARKKILDVFDEIGENPQESILTQLKESKAWRTKLDMAIAEGLGISSLLDEEGIVDLQLRIANEIDILKKLMQ